MYNPSYHSGLVQKISVTVRGEGEHGGIGTVDTIIEVVYRSLGETVYKSS